MKRFVAVAFCLILGAVAGRAAASEGAKNVEDFDFVARTVEANYSGWETKTAGSRRSDLDGLVRRLREDVVRGDDAALRRALQTFVGWFDDGHLQIAWKEDAASRPWPSRTSDLDEKSARRLFASPGRANAPVEGLWTIGDRYRVAVIRRGGSRTFDAVVVRTEVEGWRTGELKAVLEERADGGFSVAYGAGDKTEITGEARLRGRDDVLDAGDLGVWRRVYDDPAQAAAARRRWPSDAFAIGRLDTETLYLRLPSFNDAYTQTVRELIEAHAGELSRTPNLIVDVRMNGGGSDFVYDPVLPYLYTRPIWRPGVEIRVSPDNMRLRREVAERIRSASPEAAQTLASESDRMRAATEPFIRREPPLEVVRLAGATAFPSRVAVLIDGAGSSAENFIMDARQSRKVVLMGQENSAGVIDFGEMMSTPAPSGRFELYWATTRSLRLPHDPVDPDGIAADVRIPETVDDPVAFAADWLKRQDPTP